MSTSRPAHGAKIIERGTATPPQRVLCICGKEQCKLMTICFQSLNDLRGNFVRLPMMGASYHAELKEHRLKRAMIHLDMYSPDKDLLGTVDLRRKKDKEHGSDRILRSSPPAPPTQTKRFLALHHYNPAIVKLMSDQGVTNFDCITSEIITEFRLLESGEYSEADLYNVTFSSTTKKAGRSILSKLGGTVEGPYYVPVPSYKHAKDDYILISTNWRLKNMVKECQSKFRENSTLAPNGEDGILLPVQKRSKLQALPAMDLNNISNLQRGVFMLTEELNEANAEIKRLKEELRLRDARDVVLLMFNCHHV